MKKGNALACLVLASVCATGCRSSKPAVWMSPVGESSQAPTFDVRGDQLSSIAPGGAQVQLAGAINEVLDFQVELRSSEVVVDPELVFGALKNRRSTDVIPAPSVYRVHRVHVPNWPGWQLRARSAKQRESNPWDALVPVDAPVGGLPAALEAKRVYRFWVDVGIPKGTTPGDYLGRLMLTSRGQSLALVNVHVAVWPFVLPDDAGPVFIADVDYRRLIASRKQAGTRLGSAGSDGRSGHDGHADNTLLDETLRLLHRHRIAPTLSGLSPTVTPRAKGSVKVDWKKYDDIVSPLLAGELFADRVALQYWPIPLAPVQTAWEDNLEGSAVGSSVSKLSRAYLTEVVRHYQTRGWSARSYLSVAPTMSAELRASGRLGRVMPGLRQGLDGLPLLSHRGPEDLTPYGWVGYPANLRNGWVDIWMPPAQFYEPAAMEAERAKGKRTWLSMDRPPFSGTTAIQGSATDVRILAWQGLRLEAEVVHLGLVNAWPAADGRGSLPDDCVRANAQTIIFPGAPFGLDHPIPSVRLKRLRRSAQDAAYLQLMYDRGIGHVATTLLETLSPPAGAQAYRTHFADGEPIRWPTSQQSFDAARLVMASEILRGMEVVESSTSPSFTASAAWRHLMVDRRRVELGIEGVRVREAGSNSRRKTEVTCVVRITNRSRIPVTGRLHFQELPAGWRPTKGQHAVDRLPPDESRLIRLTASLPVDPSGLVHAAPLSLAFDAETMPSVEVQAHVAVVVAQPIDRKINIDGALSDWPFGSLNVARALTPISGGVSDGVRGQDAPLTLFFFARDREFLYIGVNCVLPTNKQPPVVRSNRVTYDDLIPVGEDLVEVLFDPLNSESRSPGDFLHVVVKYSGASVVEKGIDTLPPCCVHEPWPIAIDIESRVMPGRWTTEMRLPLKALGIGPSDSAMIGLNLTRFDTGYEDYYTWSGATQTAYDPLSAGNLYIPAMPSTAGR